MYGMRQARVDRFSGNTYLVQKTLKTALFCGQRRHHLTLGRSGRQTVDTRSIFGVTQFRTRNFAKTENFHKSLRTRKFSMGKFFAASATKSLCTQDSEYLYERGVQNFFDRVFPARSWEMPVNASCQQI